MDDKKRTDEAAAAEPRKNEKLTRREAMKRMAKGIALIGTLGVAGVVTQGQDECSGGYYNFYSDTYYNYSDYNYGNMYTEYSEWYYNYNNYLDSYNYANSNW